MAAIIEKKKLSENVTLMRLAAPLVAEKALAGQFVVLRVNDTGERFPLTIAEKDTVSGAITVIFQEVGKSTSLLGSLKVGDDVRDLIGPLGCPTEIKKYGTVVTVGGGVGVAEVYPVTRAFQEAGNRTIAVIGARNKGLVILEEKMRASCDELFVTTDDGSYGRKGFVSDVLKELIARGDTIDLVYAIGPVPMMRVVAEATRPHAIRTLVSLNAVMLDATGMCGTCRVTVGGTVKFACVDGPEFDGHAVEWQELLARTSAYRDEEKVSLERFQHTCKLAR